MRFLIFALLLAAPAVYGQDAPPSLADLGGKPTWEKLPGELTHRALPLTAIRLDIGKTSEGEEYLQIEPDEDPVLKFAVVPVKPEAAKYQVEAGRAVYWPALRLLAFEKDVVVSASAAHLEGRGFDLLLPHDTVRLVDPKVVSINKTLTPIESKSVRIGGLGGSDPPLLKWSESAEPQPTPTKEAALPRPVPEPTRPPLPSTPSQPVQKEFDVFIHSGGRIEFEGEDLDLRGLREKVEGLGQVHPDAVFTLHQAPSVDASLVREIHHVLEEAGYKQVKTVVDRPEIQSTRLEPETEAIQEVEDMTIPTHPGARLLWMDGPGKFFLNGKPFTEPSLRQLLRVLVRTTKEVPIVIAGPARAPLSSLEQLAQEVTAVGFDDVRLALPEGN